MLNETDGRFFRENGYLIVRDAVPADHLLAARRRLEALFAEGVYREAPHSNAHIINDLYRFAPDSLLLIFTENYFSAARGLLGPKAAWIPECAVRRDRFFGWHKDSSGVERAGMRSHRAYAPPECVYRHAETLGRRCCIEAITFIGEAFGLLFAGTHPFMRFRERQCCPTFVPLPR